MVTIEQRLDRIEKLLLQNLKASTRKTWIKVSQVQQITPWKTRDQLRTARETGLVEVKRDQNGIFYLLESIPKEFLKQTA